MTEQAKSLFGRFYILHGSSLFLQNLQKKRFTSSVYIRKCYIKSFRIPRIGNVASLPCIVKKEREFSLRIGAYNATRCEKISPIHADQKIVSFVVPGEELYSSPFLNRDPLLYKLSHGRRVYGVSNSAPYFLIARCRGGYGKSKKASFPDHILKYEFRHRTSAYIAVADKHYSFNQSFGPLRQE